MSENRAVTGAFSASSGAGQAAGITPATTAGAYVLQPSSTCNTNSGT